MERGFGDGGFPESTGGWGVPRVRRMGAAWVMGSYFSKQPGQRGPQWGEEGDWLGGVCMSESECVCVGIAYSWMSHMPGRDGDGWLRDALSPPGGHSRLAGLHMRSVSSRERLLG